MNQSLPDDDNGAARTFTPSKEGVSPGPATRTPGNTKDQAADATAAFEPSDPLATADLATDRAAPSLDGGKTWPHDTAEVGADDAGATTDFATGRPARRQEGEPTLPHVSTADGDAAAATADFPGVGTYKPPARGTVPADGEAPPEEAEGPPTVAGYEILGVLGRGAMGVVYRAVQPGLKRQVALKMILSGDHAGEHERARFRSEAEAVARLQHPNIVQIYEVGEDDGRPFFSLEFVEGSPLDKKLAHEPQAPRQAAALVETLARAMDYAHQKGIIHRDLKPANILLHAPGEKPGEFGTPKVTDFGLAKRLEEDAGQTRSGAILGTPSYMAPEQAEGRTREVGPLSDVYALGAILYELLTGRAPFKAATLLDTLEQVRTREPVPPADFLPGIPADLETICLKCLQKEAHKRYASAGALADDLRRYLAGEPILARPVGRLERLWRWCKRNPRAALLSAAVAGLIVAWGLTASGLAYGLNVQKNQTEQARKEAVHNAEEAEKNEAQAKKNEEKAEKNAAEARAKQMRAGLGMIGMAEKVQNRLRSRRVPAAAGTEVRRVREDVLGTLRESMLKMARESEESGISDFGMVRHYQQLGDLMMHLGQGEEALRQYRQGHDLNKSIADKEPDNDLARGNLAVLLMRLGDVELELNGNARAARDFYARGRDLQQEIADHPRSGYYAPKQARNLVSGHLVRVGRADLALGDPVAARKDFEQALAIREAWLADEPAVPRVRSYLSEVSMWLGIAYWHVGDVKASDESFDRAAQVCAELIKDVPDDYSFRTDLAEIESYRGDALLARGQFAEAGTSYDEARRNLDAVLKHDPDNASQLPLLASAYERAGLLALLTQKPAEAEKNFAEELKLRVELVQSDGSNLSWKGAYLVALAHCGKYADAAKGADTLRKRAPRNTELVLQIARSLAVCAAADTPERSKYLTGALAALGDATKDGYKDAVALETDPALASLRGEEAYHRLLAEVKKR